MFRRKHVLLLLLVLCLFVITLGRKAWAADDLLTLDRALALAGSGNPVLMAADKKVEQARARFKQADADRMPALGMYATYQETGEVPVYYVYSDTSWTTPLGVARAGYQQTWKAALKLSHVLYSGGAVEQASASRRFALEAVRAERERTGQVVYNGVRQAFFSLQRARAREEVSREALGLAMEHLRQVKAMYSSGVVAKNQVLRVQVAVDEARLNLIQSENAVDVAWSALERAVGVSLKGNWNLPGPSLDAVPCDIPAAPEETALLKRPELRALAFSEQAARAAARAAVGQGGPKVLLQAETYVVDQEFFPEAQDDWKVTAVAEWTFFDGGKSRARACEARAAAEELLYLIEDMKRQITMDVSMAILNFNSALKRIDLASSQVKSAGEDYRMAMKRYTAQVGTNIDVLDARVALQKARTQHVDAVYDSLAARSDLQFAMGVEKLQGKALE